MIVFALIMENSRLFYFFLTSLPLSFVTNLFYFDIFGHIGKELVVATANVFPQPVSYPWPSVSENTQSIHLRQKALSQERLLGLQADSIRCFLEEQAQRLAESLESHAISGYFHLPGQVACYPFQDGELRVIAIPPELQKQRLGGWIRGFIPKDFRDMLIERLSCLEQGPDLAVATAANLLRYAIARHIVHDRLPAGRPVAYISVEGEEIPSLPCADESKTSVEQADDLARDLTIYSPNTCRFFLPEWVSFDENDRLLVRSAQEAEDHIVRMQNYLNLLQDAARIAPYLVADKEYQRKRYGILGQLVNQGRALGRYWTSEIIQVIERRASSRMLDRGLSISLPYFDDRELRMQMLNFVVVPAGLTIFMPAFVVRAAHEEQAKAIRNPAYSFSTRKYLLIQLDMLEQAFQAARSFAFEPVPEIS